MTTPYTHKNLTEVKDSAPEFGFGEHGEVRFARDDFDAQDPASPTTARTPTCMGASDTAIRRPRRSTSCSLAPDA